MAFVHLPTGLLWSWRPGPGTAAEQVHLRFLLSTLSPQAMIVCDVAYMGFDLVRAIVGFQRSFLFRMSSRVDLYTLEKADLEDWTEGPVLYWPKFARRKGLAPIQCRLIRVPAKAKAKAKAKARAKTETTGPALADGGTEELAKSPHGCRRMIDPLPTLRATLDRPTGLHLFPLPLLNLFLCDA